MLPEGGAFGSGVDECHRRIEEPVDSRAGRAWDALAAECRAAGLDPV